MKKLILFVALLAVAALPMMGARHHFDTVEGDPLKTQMYTLPNGLKMFMSVNKDQPRIQTIIAVRVGGKNDPSETTGLAHYFEHLMFKGTKKFGTSNYEAEKPMLDSIESLFETYRHTTDSVARRQIYRAIDSISYEASKIGIPNEYDKLMSAIGANGTNAYTSQDMTCYVEDIPSNQIENWAKIQADRFENPVIRGFHTELETIYEEKNMSLTNDSRKVFERMLAALYPTHPYGTQTVLGTQENLKNPSITNVKAYHKKWYVPNNMAICLSGDFDPDEMVDIVEKYFGHLKPSDNLPRPNLPHEAPLTSPKEIEVLGPDAEQVTLAWRVPAASSPDMLAIQLLDMVLCNGKTGIYDINVALPQRILGGGAYVYGLSDAGAYVMTGRPNAGQSLDEVRAIFLEQLDKLRKGEFSDELVEAVKANMKLEIQSNLEDNSSRASYYEQAFINGVDWADEVANLARLDKITKEDIVAAANKYIGDNNYVAIYKRQGTDPNELKIAKPELTPIEMNRDKSSDFLLEIQNSDVKPIEPVFVDYAKDMRTLKVKNNVPLYYVLNTTNDLFRLTFYYQVGSDQLPILDYASELIQLVGTADMTPEQVRNEFFGMACKFSVGVGTQTTTVTVSGLNENMDKALALTEKLIENARLDKETYESYIARVEKARADSKLNQRANFSALQQYVFYGSRNPQTENLSTEQLRALDPQEVIGSLKELRNYEQSVIYWGKTPEKKVVKAVNKLHPISKKLIPAPKDDKYKMQETGETVFFIAPYEAKQLYMIGFSNSGDKFDKNIEPMRQIYNEYFGGSMNAIVFQEMRESRSLAYSAGAYYSGTGKLTRPYTYIMSIATQNDKLSDALAAFDEIINDMPRSEAAFDLAKKGLDARLRTERTIDDAIPYSFIAAKRLGYDYDRRRDLFETLPSVTLDDIEKFQKENIKGRTYYYGILAKPENIDIEVLKKLGRVVILTTEDIFGY